MTTHTQNTSAALAVITELAQQGHAIAYIAKALNLRGIPTARPGGSWYHSAVATLARRHGIAVGYRRAG